MSKKPGRSRRPQFKRTAPASASILAPRGTESAIVGLQKLLAGKEFASIDEANAFIQQTLSAHGGRLPDLPAETPLERAEQLVAEAYEQRDPAKRAGLARRALSISEDCADAYSLLAQLESDPVKQLALFEQGEAAGRRAIGETLFKNEVGHFWGIVQTRPYMRARAGVAHWAWMLGDRRRAIEIYTDMLRLNEMDNLGVRYLLASALLEDRTEASQRALEELLGKWDEDPSASLLYSKALLVFQREGRPSAAANQALDQALQANPHAPALLLGEQKMPADLPSFIGSGDVSEAADYVSTARAAWQQTSGALSWLRGQR